MVTPSATARRRRAQAVRRGAGAAGERVGTEVDRRVVVVVRVVM
jgi:hypothetical protein